MQGTPPPSTNRPGPRGVAALACVALAGFVALTVLALTSEPTLARLDVPVERMILSHRSAWLDRSMVWLTFLGTRWAIGAATLALLVWSLVTGRHRRFVFLIVAAVLLNPVFEITFKVLVDRVRPAVSQLLPGNGPSFPSGHVLAAVGFYGLIPFLTREVTGDGRIRTAALVGSLAIIAAVTVSRPYLDVHWTTDVLAGVLLGTVLVLATYGLFVRLRPAPLASK